MLFDKIDRVFNKTVIPCPCKSCRGFVNFGLQLFLRRRVSLNGLSLLTGEKKVIKTVWIKIKHILTKGLHNFVKGKSCFFNELIYNNLNILKESLVFFNELIYNLNILCYEQ